MRPTSVARWGSDPTAAGGGRREASAVQRSVSDAAALSARRAPGTANRAAPIQRKSPKKASDESSLRNHKESLAISG